MEIIKDFVPESKYNIKCPYSMKAEFIVVHNTANDASAKNEIAYMKSNNNATSYHFAVDDIEVRQAIPLNRNAWHAGDGNNGNGNRCGISIEICYSKSGGEKFDKAEEKAAMLIASILKENDWGINRVRKHQDFSGKYCPHKTLDLGWDRFINKVKGYMEGTMSKFVDIEGHYSEKAINDLFEMGIVKGVDETHFKPDEPIKRGDVAIMARNIIKYITGK